MKKRTITCLTLMLLLAALLLCGCGAQNSADDEDPGAASFTYEKNDDDTITLTGYTGEEASVTVPDSIDGLAVSAIGESCFAGNVHLTKAYVPEGVKTLGDYAFECCSVLEKVYLPESLTEVGDGAFSGCCRLYLVDMQNNVARIGRGAFLECGSLVSFIAPKALEEIGEFAFANCSELVKADMKETALTELPDRLFYDCAMLSAVRLPESLTAVGKRAFSQNKSMMYIYLPESVAHIGSYAFEYCENLQNFAIPCDEVEAYTFNCCSGLTYVSFPETLKKIDEGAFRNTNLDPADLEIPSRAEVDEHAFGYAESEESDEYSMPDEKAPEDTAAMPAADTTVAEITAQATEKGYLSVSRDDFTAWADKYMAFNAENALLDGELNPYISKYKGEIGYYYQAMTAVASGVPEEIEAAGENFGDDFEAMYQMIDHGLATEMRRFRMEDDMLLYTGVYDFQLKNITGKDTAPTVKELKDLVGTTFTDPCLTSTTTEAQVAFGFSDTLFVIYAPAENVNALGSVCMDSYMHTFENEILLCSGATYKILDAGVLEDTVTDFEGKETTDCRNFVLLQLINE